MTLKQKLTNRLEVLAEQEPIVESVKENLQNKIVPLNANAATLVNCVPEFAISLSDAKERITMLQHFVKEMMIPNVDYDMIPKCDKPSLFKSGAEKLCDIFGFSKHIEIMNRMEDWEKGIFHYEVKATLISKRTGMIEAEGIGCCNSRERKYKSSDPFSIMNTILKMAKKRALIDAVLSATRSSGIFTQDIEDVESCNPQIKSNELLIKQNFVQINPINKAQLTEIFTIVAQKKIPVNKMMDLMLKKYKVAKSKLLNEQQANDLIKYLKSYSG